MLDHVPGKNTISTYGVKLAGDLPRVELEEGRVIIIPSCRNETDGGNCALVDFRKLEPPEGESGKDYYFVSWEDSEQGGDYDQDLNGVISIGIGQADPSGARSVTVTTQIYQVSTRKEMLFGYVISGVGADSGLHQTSRVVTNVRYYLENPNQPPTETSVRSCNDNATCDGSYMASKTFAISADPNAAQAKELEDPLWFATKWGGFTDQNPPADTSNYIPIPDLESEWEAPDENPVGYTLVRNPADLGSKLKESIKGLIKRPASGSGAAVASNTLTGEGLLLQAGYKPEVASGTDKVSWVGVLNGLFFDAFGNVREDTNSNQKLDAADNIVQIYYDSTAKDTLVRRMPFSENIESIPAANITSGLSLESIRPVWSARDQLADLTNAQKAEQRIFGESASTGRYIFTSVDEGTAEAAPDGITTGNDVIDFSASAFDGTNTTAGLGVNNYRLLDVAQNDAGKVVDFIRGVEGIEGFRNRTVNYNGVAPKPWILGDIVHSTPAVVGRPSAGYNVSYSDQTYTAFRNQYLNRRQVAYVGANDGMLHAFNMGIYNEMTQTFDGSGHPLGGELWAYVPYNLLPHLKWLTQPGYEHVYYVDSSVKTYDVNIFPSTGDDGRYPYGWGTIMVVGMRFGGGEYSVSIEGETDPRKLRSAYMIFDITDPEREPKLIAEITDEDLGYTITEPELVQFRQSKEAGGFLTGDTRKNSWYLVFGNGPTDLTTGTSDNSAKLFYLDLEKARRGQVELEEEVVTTSKGHIGGLRAVDWDGDFQDDYLYISVVGEGGENLGGLYHARLASNNVIGTVNPLLDGVSAPFSVPVLPVRNLETGDFWVFAGTGRLLVSSDLENEGSGAYYGIKVSQNSGTSFETSVDIDDMYPVTGHSLYEKDVYGAATIVVDADGVQLGTLEEFQEEKIDRTDNKGWYKTFTRNGESNFVPTSLFRSALLINSYTPGISDCEPLGKSYLYALNAFNGLPDASLGNLARSTSDTVGDYEKVEETYGELDGVAMNVSFTDTDTGFIGTSTSVVKGQKYETKPTPGARRSWTEIPLDIVQ
jgi:type IV pilus assembly protein PilY1